jgi:hypothetical protein
MKAISKSINEIKYKIEGLKRKKKYKKEAALHKGKVVFMPQHR